MPAKTFRRSKRNLERQFLIDNNIDVIWHRKTAHQTEPLFQLALNKLAEITGNNIFDVYNQLNSRLEYLKLRAQDVEQSEKGEIINHDGGFIDKLSTCQDEELRAQNSINPSPITPKVSQAN